MGTQIIITGILALIQSIILIKSKKLSKCTTGGKFVRLLPSLPIIFYWGIIGLFYLIFKIIMGC
jgi:hypothetical protein